jgi:transposase
MEKMDAYSMDLRERVVAACDARDGTRARIAVRFSVSVRWIGEILRRRRRTGSIAAKPHGGGRPPAFDEAASARLREAARADAGATLGELAESAGVACSAPAVYRALRRLGITRKKGRGGRPSRTAPN